MATFTITAANTNIDSLASKTGGDIYNVNGWQLVIDQDSRYWTNQNTSASLWSITISASLGGSVTIDGSAIWLIPYTWWSGTVPAFNTVISNGSGSGKLIWVHANISAQPELVGNSMPATGFIRVKQKTGAYTSWALTGITATASDAWRVGRLEIVWDEAATINANRLWSFNITGAWYEIGTTNWIANQQIQIPRHWMNRYIAGVFIEKTVWWEDYEFYANAWTATTIWTEATRWKVCWVDATGLLRIGHNWTGNAWYVPISWLKIVIGNVFLENCTTAARTVNVIPNATIATRYDFTTTWWWVVNIDKCNMARYLSCSQAYSVNVSNSWFIDWILLSEIATAMTFSKVWVWNKPTTALLMSPLTMTYCFAGWTFTDCVWARVSMAASGAHTNTISDIDWFSFVRDTIRANTIRANATTFAVNGTRIKNTIRSNPTLIQWSFNLTTCDNIVITDIVYCEAVSWTTVTTYAWYVVTLTSSTINCTISWLTIPVADTQPYTALFALGIWCNNNKIRNIWTRVSPLNLWTVNACWLIYTISTWCFNTKFQRIYCSNTRSWIMTWDNSCKGLIEENVFGDYADASDVMAVLNMQRKWMWWTGALTAQTSVYGAHWRDWFISTTVWRIALLMNEPTAETAAQVSLSNGAWFTSVWSLYMPVIGMSVTFTTPDYIIWHTGFSNTAIVMAWGTAGNYTYYYQIDKNDGNWYSALSIWYTAAGLWTALSWLTGIDASLWFKLKLTITTSTTNATAITSVYLVTTTTTTAQDYQYPLDTANVTLTWLVAGTEVNAFTGTPWSATNIGNTNSSGSSFTFSQSVSWVSWFITIHKEWYVFMSVPIVYSDSDVSIPIQQQADPVFVS